MEEQPNIVESIDCCPMCKAKLPGPILLTAEGDHLIQLEENEFDQVFFTDQGLLRLIPIDEIPNCFNIEILHEHE